MTVEGLFLHNGWVECSPFNRLLKIAEPMGDPFNYKECPKVDRGIDFLHKIKSDSGIADI